MTTTEARWMQIVFWTMEDVIALHTIEMSMNTANNAAPYQAGSMIENLSASRYGLSPFWGKSDDHSFRSEETARFLRAIYPIHAGIERRAAAVKGRREIETLHEQDLAIVKSGIKPNRGGAGK